MEIKETYNSLQQEVDVKTKKLKKVSPTLLGDSTGWGSAGKDALFLRTVCAGRRCPHAGECGAAGAAVVCVWW